MRAFIFIFAMTLSGAARADFSGGTRGTSAAEFLQLGVGARAVAMGEAYASVADEASAVYWNPAALTQIHGHSVTLMHAAYIDSSFFDYGAYGQSLGKYGAVGAAVQYFSAGSIAQTDAVGNDIGTFSPYDLAVTASYAFLMPNFDFMNDLNGFSVGLSGKYIQSRILTSAQTGAADIGLLSPYYLGGRLKGAFTVTNIGGRLKFDQTAEPLPLTMTLGSSFKITPQWLASLDARFPKDDQPILGVGTEYWIVQSASAKMAGRLGFNTETIGSITGFTGLSMGFGLGFGSASFDYAFVPMGGLGQAHRVSLTFGF